MTWKEGAAYRVRVPAGERPPTLHAIVGNRGVMRRLEEGQVLVCKGQGWGWGSDPGLEVRFLDPEGEYGLMHFMPVVGHWIAAEPDPRFLEEVNHD